MINNPDRDNLPASKETSQQLSEVITKMRYGFYSTETGISLEFPIDPLEKQTFLAKLDSAFGNDRVREFLHPLTPFINEEEGTVTTQEFWEFFYDPASQCFFMPATVIDEFGNTKLIGVGSFMGVDNVDGLISAERGVIVFDPENWGLGYGKKIGITLMLWAKSVGIQRITSGTYTNNIASRTILEKQMVGLGATSEIQDADSAGDPKRGPYITYTLDLRNITDEQILLLLGQ